MKNYLPNVHNLIEGKIYYDNCGNKWRFLLYDVEENDYTFQYASETNSTTKWQTDLIQDDYYLFDDELNFVGEEDNMWLIPITLADKLNLL
jgi:hypothetical protein